MEALTPVGRFPVRLTGARLGRNGPVLDASMGVWRTELELERSETVGTAAAILALLLLLGGLRASRKRAH